MKTVFTNGVFDLLHRGHIDLLWFCKDMQAHVVVGINSDASVKRLKGDSRPINDQDTRKRILESLRCVDQVVIFDEDTPLEIIKFIKPDIIVKGGDYTKDQVVGNQLCEVVIFPFLSGFSTSKIIERIRGQEEDSSGGRLLH